MALHLKTSMLPKPLRIKTRPSLFSLQCLGDGFASLEAVFPQSNHHIGHSHTVLASLR